MKTEHSKEFKIGNVVTVILVIIIIVCFYFLIFCPSKTTIAKKVSRTAALIEQETLSIYKSQEYVFDENDKDTNELCKILSKKLAKNKVNCKNLSLDPEYNFVVKKTGAEILGLENIPRQSGENLVKEFLIDYNGSKHGKNLMGVDIFPVKIYSKGMIAARVLPVNCNFEDFNTFGIEYSALCRDEAKIDYLDTIEPFSYNVVKVGSEDGKNKTILHNVSFIRADCAANAGDMIAGDYCEEKKIDWLSACYEDTPCAIELNSKK